MRVCYEIYEKLNLSRYHNDTVVVSVSILKGYFLLKEVPPYLVSGNGTRPWALATQIHQRVELPLNFATIWSSTGLRPWYLAFRRVRRDELLRDRRNPPKHLPLNSARG